jgi:hypothetical protein
LRWALAVGKTPRELLQQVTSADVSEMLAFQEIEPFGCYAEDIRFGQIAASIFNSQRTKHEDPVHRPSDFMPALHAELERSKPPPRVLSAQERSDLIDAQIFGKAITS